MQCFTKDCPYHQSVDDTYGKCGRSTAHILQATCRDRFGGQGKDRPKKPNGKR